jgi:hypothetical protein
MAHTAVEWLLGFIEPSLTSEQKHFFSKVIGKAKQIEKENIAKAWDSGKHQYFSLGIPEIEFNNGEEYYNINYNQTYNK